MDAQAEKQHLLDQINEYADPEYARVISRTIPSKLEVYGLRVLELREIVRAWRRAHKDVVAEDLLALAEALWDGQSREERMLALELLQHYAQYIPDLTWSTFEHWRRDLDNWELTRLLGVGVLGIWVLGDADARAQHLRDLIADEDVWSRRLGLVGALGLNRARKDASFPELTFASMDQV